MVLLGTHLYLSPSLPSVESLRDIRLQTPLRIYSKDNKLIGEIGEKRRTPVKFHDIPTTYIDALLSAEDDQFYSHSGVSITGLMRASSQLLMSGSIRGGGSTITMQVARNFFLSKRQEFKRKFNEILLALRIERELTKEEILELYVNVIFLGNRAYGIQAASQVYYGKPLSELSLPQIAMIAGLPKAPSTVNPIANPERAHDRRNWILGRMLELDKITDSEYQDAIKQPITAVYHGNNLDLNASYIAEMARSKAIDLFGGNAYTDGYRVYTTIDSSLQASAQQAVIKGLLEYDQRHGYRGPEQQLPTPQAVLEIITTPKKIDQQDSSAPDTPTIVDQEPIITEWRQSLKTALKDIPSYAGLLPAAVIEVNEKNIKLLLSDNRTIDISWEQGLSAARPYRSVNSLGPKPKAASDIVAIGDVVRLGRDTKNQWRFYQLPEAQAALVSLNPNNGAILGLLGGLDFRQSNFNRAIQAKRQPGSNFKPFLYTAALENGYTAATIINDAPIVFKDEQLESSWRPENSNSNFLGPIRLRKALYKSINLVSIRILKNLGINTALENIDRFGLNKADMPKDLSLALGSYAMTPLEVATGYAVFANGGYKVESHYIDKILDVNGHTVFETLPLTVCEQCNEPTPNAEIATLSPTLSPTQPTPSNDTNEEIAEYSPLFIGDPFSISRELKAFLGILGPKDYPTAPRVIDEQTAYIMDSILKDVVKRGTATKAKTLGRNDLAGKTGTTNSATDAWFSGYGGGIVTTAWVGFDQVSTLGRREYGGSAALPIWIHFMRDALNGKAEINRPQPPGLVTLRIDPTTGKRAQIGDPNAIFEVFKIDNVPEMDENQDQNLTPWKGNNNVTTDRIF